MLSSLIVPGGLLGRFLGLAVVTGDGTEISRARSLVRTVVAWSPAIGWLAYLVTAPKIQGWVRSPDGDVGCAAMSSGISQRTTDSSQRTTDWPAHSRCQM